MNRRKKPRHFTYLDQATAESYLSDLRGGLPEGGSTTERATTNERGGWRLGTRGTGLQGNRDTEGTQEDQETFRYTPEAIFRLLYEELIAETDEEGKVLVNLDDLDQKAWEELEDGDIVEIRATIQVPEVIKAVDAAKSIQQFLPALESMGALLGEGTEGIDFSQQDRSLLEGMGDMKEIMDSQDATVVVMQVTNAPRYKFVAKLKKSLMRAKLVDIEGEAKVLGTIRRKLRGQDPPIGFEQLIPGFESMRVLGGQQQKSMNRAARRAKGKRREQGTNDTSIGYPAATLIPIAIY